MKVLQRLFFLMLAVSALLILGCGKADLDVQEVLTIKEGRHRATPYRASWNDCRMFFYEWEVDESWQYELGDEDQCDWNKLTGHSFHKIGNHENSIMASWRYDRSDFIVFAPYYHSGGSTYWASAPCTSLDSSGVVEVQGTDPSLGYITASIGDVIETHFNINYSQDWAAVTIINQSNGMSTYFEHTFTEKDIKNQREIYPWFGGNEDAPHDILFYRTLKGTE